MTTRTAFGLLAGAAVLALAAPATAQAAPFHEGHEGHKAPRNCASGALCAYSGAHYTGRVTVIRGDNRNLLHKRALRHIESVYNTGRHDAVIWDHKDFKGHRIEVGRNRGEVRLPHRFGHDVASNKWETHRR